MGLLPDPLKELKDLSARNQRRQLTDAAASRVDQVVADRIGAMLRWHPWLPPGVSMSMAQAGIDPLSDEATAVSAKVVADTANKSPLGYAKPGDTVKAANLTQQQIDAARAGFIQQQTGTFRADAPARYGNLQPMPVGSPAFNALPADQQKLVMQLNASQGRGYLGNGVSSPGVAGVAGIAAATVNPSLGSTVGGAVQTVDQFARDNPVTNNVIEPAVSAVATGSNPVASSARGAVRVTTAALQSPQQLAQAQYRTSMENIRQHGVIGGALGMADPRQQLQVASQLDIGHVLAGEKTGSGFFTSDQAAKNRRTAEAQAGGTYGNGQVRTIGRDLADVFFEPGSQEFNVLSGFGDAAVALGADAVVTNPVQGSRAAAKAFRETQGITEATNPASRALENVIGLIRGGDRATYNPQLVDAYLSSGAGRSAAERLASEASISRLDAITGRTLDPKLLSVLANETDPTAITELMRSQLGVGWREAPAGRITAKIQNLGFTFKDALPKGITRLGGNVPIQGLVDFNDPREVLTQAERMLTNTKAPRETIDRFMAQIAEAPNMGAMRQPWIDMIGDIGARLGSEQGVDEGMARKLTKLYTKNNESGRKFWVDELGNTMTANPMRALVDGKLVEGPTVHLSSEMFNGFMPQPDVRALRAEFSNPVTKWIARNQAGDPRSMWVVSQGFQDKVWKPMALLRGAWPMRVLGEEQFRIAADGLSSLTSDPVGYMAFLLGDSPRVGRMLEKFGIQGRGGEDIFGGLMRESDAFGAAMMHGHGGFTDERVLSNMDLFNKGESGYAAAHADEIKTLAADPIAPVVARLYTTAPAESATAIGNPLLNAQDFVWNHMADARNELAASQPNAWANVLTREGSDEYVRSITTRIQQKTQEVPELISAVATGRINGVHLFEPGTPFLSKAAIKEFEHYADAGPQVVRGPIRLPYGGGPEPWTNPANKLVEAGFEHLMTKPANYLSRSQVFRQHYVDEIIALAPKVSADDLEPLLKYADNANLTAKDAKTLRTVIGTATGDDPMPLEALDTLAKGHALHDTKALLYDLADRGQFFDTFRLIFPFGEAWTEMVTKWGALIKKNPKVTLTVKRILEAGRNPTVGSIVGAPEGKGAFYRDEYGEERFTYPLSGQLMSLVGLPEVPLTGRLQGLSLMTEVLPGIGPIAQMPLAALVPDKPAFDGLSQLLFPYGRPAADVTAITNMLPSWARTVVFGATGGFGTAAGQRQYSNTVMDVMRYNASTGDYQISGNPNSAAEITRMLEDSKSQATWLTLIRGMAQNVSPSSPTFEWYIKTPDGQKLPMLTLVADYRKMQEDNFETATQTFLAKYGDNAFLLMQGKSMTTSPGVLPPTDVANDWLRDNSWAQKSYGATYGFFAPQGGNFSSQAYQRQLDLEERQPLTPEEFVKAGNNMIGSSIYYAARGKLPASLSSEQSAAMRALDEALRTEYEGYGDEAGLPGKANTNELIDELGRAVADPRLKDTPMAKSIGDYLKLRAAVKAKSLELFGSEVSYQSAKGGQSLRAALDLGAQTLTAQNPDFAAVWERVFRRELDAGFKKDDAGDAG